MSYDDDTDRITRLHDTIKELRAEIERLRTLALALLGAARDVQEHWSDPGCYTHNRLLTPMLVHEDTIRALEEK